MICWADLYQPYTVYSFYCIRYFMVLVYVISVIMKKYTVSYIDGCYLVNRSCHIFYLVQWPTNAHNYFTNYYTATCFATIVSSSGRSPLVPCQVTPVNQKQLLVIQFKIRIFHIGFTTVVEISMFKILKILKLSYLQNNGLKSFCWYLMASVCVVAVCTICMLMLRRASSVCKIKQVGIVCCAV